MIVRVKLASGAEIRVGYEDLLSVRRRDLVLPARVELLLKDDAEAAELIEELFEPSERQWIH
jgi:hypothetical protein